jgi:hypothetical protein
MLLVVVGSYDYHFVVVFHSSSICCFTIRFMG